MIALEEAQKQILATVRRLSTVTVPLVEALGLVTAEPLAATEPIPPFANTAMDGYAVRAADTAGAAPGSPVRLRVVGDLPAGHRADDARRAGRGDPDHDRRPRSPTAPTRS